MRRRAGSTSRRCAATWAADASSANFLAGNPESAYHVVYEDELAALDTDLGLELEELARSIRAALEETGKEPPGA